MGTESQLSKVPGPVDAAGDSGTAMGTNPTPPAGTLSD